MSSAPDVDSDGAARKTFDIDLSLGEFRREEGSFDVTLVADSADGSTEALGAHKLILCAASPVLRSLIKEQARVNPGSSMFPLILYLRGISARGLGLVLDLAYKGSVSLGA